MNWIFKNKKMPCEKSTSEFFCKLNNILCSKKTKTILVVLVLVCIFMAPPAINFTQAADTSTSGATAVANSSPTTNYSGMTGNPLSSLVGEIMLGVQNFMVLLLTGAVAILETMLNPDAMSGTNGLLNSQVVKDIWVMTRDVLNMFFILVLLFSAFCTIFQVEKWNLKKIWLNVLINALLVNFSFPIARFFIDVSNVAMYYFLNNMFTGATSGTAVNGSSIAASFAKYSNLSSIFTPSEFVDLKIMYELAIIVFTFIFAITILILAVLFVIRLIVLGMIVMFSPIGFVGFIFPSTQKFAGDWWSNLFNYAFFGPIMVFMMSVSLQIASVVSLKTKFAPAAVKNVSSGSSVSTDFLASIAAFAMPIVILWFAMGISKKMGIAGADMVVGKAQGFAKWVGKKAAMMGPGNWAKKNWEQFSKQRKARQDEKDKNRIGSTLGKKLNYAQDRFSPFESSRKRAERMRQDENKENIEKGAKSLVEGGANVETLSRDLNRHFATTATTKDEKIKHAQHAAAYLKQDNDEKKQHIIDHLEATGSLAGSDFENIIGSGAGLTGREKRMHDEVVKSANEIAAGNSNEEHVRRVAAHVNKKMREKMEEGAKAT